MTAKFYGSRQFHHAAVALLLVFSAHNAYGGPGGTLQQGTALQEAGNFTGAIKKYDEAIRSGSGGSRAYHLRGTAHFFAGDITASLADFDTYLTCEPDRAPHHWQRGITLYYIGNYAGGVSQFETHRTVNPYDVENAVWHFLCKVRAESLEAARETLIPYTQDSRVPMKEIHALFAGTGSPEAVLAAAESGEPTAKEKRNRLCYAHLYLGLFAEATGKPGQALTHMRKAAEDYSMPHYMGRVAMVHLSLRKNAQPQP